MSEIRIRDKDELIAQIEEHGANLSYAYLSNADLRNADLSNADLSNADLSNADLRYAYLSNADLRNAYLSNADLRYANLSYADLSGADLSNADLRYANLSGAKGLLDPIMFLHDNFELKFHEGEVVAIYAYKTFNNHYAPPESWQIEAGFTIREACNPCRVSDCASGINVAPIGSSELGSLGDVWKVKISGLALAGIVVPYHTDGKIRCSECQLIEIVKRDIDEEK